MRSLQTSRLILLNIKKSIRFAILYIVIVRNDYTINNFKYYYHLHRINKNQ